MKWAFSQARSITYNIDDEMTALELCFLAILSLIALLLPRIQCFLDSASTHFANFANVTNHTTSDTSYYSHTTQNPQNSSQHSLNAYFSILPIPFVFMMNICVLFVMRSFWLISHWFIMCAFIGGFTLGVCIYLHKSPTNTQKIWYLWILFIIGLGFLILDMSFGDFLSSAQYSIAPIFFVLLAVYYVLFHSFSNRQNYAIYHFCICTIYTIYQNNFTNARFICIYAI